MKEIEVFIDRKSVDIKVVEECEELIGYKFPNNYKILLSKHNGLYPERNTFKYFDEVVKREENNSIYFYAFKHKNLDPLYSDGYIGRHLTDEYTPKELVPFGGTGNGDYICFDYRDDLKTDKPKIVLLHHDAKDDENNLMISFLSNSFEEFMDSLYIWEE